MSGTTTTPAAPEPLVTPQTIVACIGMAIVAGTMAATLWQGDAQLRSQALVGAIAIGSAITGYYFGSSSGSKGKDAAIVSLAGNQPAVSTVSTVKPGETVTETKPAVTP